MTTYALAGNPNAGKTSLFNLLTGTREYVGNWTGVTVEKKIGRMKHDPSIEVVDLPGIYSLSPFSIEERVASKFLVNEQVDGIINIVDASNLERNLYFTMQLLEYGKPLIMSLNMMDVAQAYGINIDLEKLRKKLAIPIVPMMVRKGKGYNEFINTLNKTFTTSSFEMNYGLIIEEAIQKIIKVIIKLDQFKENNHRWVAIQLLEGNSEVEELIKNHQEIISIKSIKTELNEQLGKSVEHVIREERYKWIAELLKEIMIVESGKRKSWTEKVDSIVMNKWIGIPLFFFFMYLTFQLTFAWIGAPLQDILDRFFSGPLSTNIEKLLILIGASDWLIRLVVDGIIAGVGGVLIFVPQIFVLFFIISFLEDSGYMARVAFIMDKAMSKIGLNGKAFIPMIVSFGCNVPGIMSARTLEQPKERLITILLSPFMSCSARLAVYALFTSIFFEKYQSLVVLSLYILGIVLAMLLGVIFKKFLLKEEDSLFVIELPPYRVPMIRSLLLNTWDKGKGFIKKAGTIIFSMAVFLWFLANFSWTGMVTDMNQSFLAGLGEMIAPLFAPLGFGTWQSGVALISGFMAKEIVISTMAIVYGTGGETLSHLSTIIQGAFTPVSAYAFMVFILLYTPCVSTVIIMKDETGSWKWPLVSIGYSFFIAWILAFIVYQVGNFLF